MWILPLVGYLGSIVGFCFLTLAIGTWSARPPTSYLVWTELANLNI